MNSTEENFTERTFSIITDVVTGQVGEGPQVLFSRCKRFIFLLENVSACDIVGSHNLFLTKPGKLISFNIYVINTLDFRFQSEHLFRYKKNFGQEFVGVLLILLLWLHTWN